MRRQQGGIVSSFLKDAAEKVDLLALVEQYGLPHRNVAVGLLWEYSQ